MKPFPIIPLSGGRGHEEKSSCCPLTCFHQITQTLSNVFMEVQTNLSESSRPLLSPHRLSDHVLDPREADRVLRRLRRFRVSIMCSELRKLLKVFSCLLATHGCRQCDHKPRPHDTHTHTHASFQQPRCESRLLSAKLSCM